MRHQDIPVGYIHSPFNYIYADATARLGAVGFAAGDVNKVALDVDDGTIWRVSAVDPGGNATWQELAGALPSTLVNDASGPNAPLEDRAGNQLVNIPTFQADTIYPAGYVIQQGGILYARIALGVSGASFAADAASWTALTAAGTELAFAAATATQAGVGTAATDLTGLTITFTAPSRPVMLEAWIAGAQQVGAAGIPQVQITDSANNIQVIAGAGQQAAGNFTAPIIPWVRLGALVAGNSYTFKCRGLTSASTCNFDASATQQSFLRAFQV